MDNFYSPLAVGSGPLVHCSTTSGQWVLPQNWWATSAGELLSVERGCKPLVVAQNFKVICSLIQQLDVTPHSWDCLAKGRIHRNVDLLWLVF